MKHCLLHINQTLHLHGQVCLEIKHQVALPVSTYLIEHPKGLILIDTGWHTDNRTKQLRNLSFQYPINKADLPEGQAIHEQLIKLGYKPSDIDYILMSHMHCDHADGLRLVKQAKTF